jgi:hypothetical protein
VQVWIAFYPCFKTEADIIKAILLLNARKTQSQQKTFKQSTTANFCHDSRKKG